MNNVKVAFSALRHNSLLAKTLNLLLTRHGDFKSYDDMISSNVNANTSFGIFSITSSESLGLSPKLQPNILSIVT